MKLKCHETPIECIIPADDPDRYFIGDFVSLHKRGTDMPAIKHIRYPKDISADEFEKRFDMDKAFTVVAFPSGDVYRESNEEKTVLVIPVLTDIEIVLTK
jgi:hypothetical protein